MWYKCGSDTTLSLLPPLSSPPPLPLLPPQPVYIPHGPSLWVRVGLRTNATTVYLWPYWLLLASTETAARPVPQRKLSIDPEAAEKLEKRLAQRPDKHELIERNILKGTRLIPL